MMEFNKIHGSAFKPLHGSQPITPNNLFDVCKKFIGGGMSQSYAALYIFEHYIQLNNFNLIIEIGSQKGALSLYFANMAGATEKFLFHTYEINKHEFWYDRAEEGVGHWFEKLEAISPYISSFEEDIFSDAAVQRISNLMKDHRALIFCDGGNKIREFNLFAPMIKKDDRIMVHDWPHEIAEQHIKQTLDRENIVYDEPYGAWCTTLDTRLMPFKRAE